MDIKEDGKYTAKYKLDNDSKWEYAKHQKNPNKGQKCKFDKRQQAAQWFRNQPGVRNAKIKIIIHPDGTEEKFDYVRWSLREKK